MGNYSKDIVGLLQEYCTVENSCSIVDLSAALTAYSDIFNLTMSIDNTATSCVNYQTSNYTGGPCFVASIMMSMSSEDGGIHQVTGSIRENRYLEVNQTPAIHGS